MNLSRSLSIVLAIYLSIPALTTAREVYQKPEEFVSQVFSGTSPEPHVLKLTTIMRARIKAIMGHDLGVRRLRYWGVPGRTAWIVEEIGKERPITTGIVINNGKVESLKVLIYRESRGFEVRYPFFTDQFKGATLTGADELDRSIDGISGATLSTRALTKLARLALYLHQQSESLDAADT